MFFTFAFLPEQASTHAGEVDALYLYLIAVSVFFSVLIFTIAGVFAFRYKRRSETEIPKPIHGNLLLEGIWSFIPLVIALSFFFWGALLFFKNSTPPDEAMEIFVVGKQWMWKIQHPEGPREINELHIPVGRPVKLKMASEDVIHSFYVPAFRTKMDVVPGRYTTMWFEATRPGRYHLFCAEYCGTKHAGMTGWVIAMEENDFAQWLAGAMGESPAGDRLPESMAQRGEKLFREFRCNTCHQDSPMAVGASLRGVYGSPVELADGRTVTADDNYLRESILKPAAKIVKGYTAVMPSYQGQINEEQVMAILAYLKTQDGTDAKNSGSSHVS